MRLRLKFSSTNSPVNLWLKDTTETKQVMPTVKYGAGSVGLFCLFILQMIVLCISHILVSGLSGFIPGKFPPGAETANKTFFFQTNLQTVYVFCRISLSV